MEDREEFEESSDAVPATSRAVPWQWPSRDGTESSTADYWNAVFSRKRTAPQLATIRIDRLGEVIQLIEECGARSVIDLGAGYCDLGLRLRERSPDIHVEALDFSTEARRRSGFWPYTIADMARTPFEDKEFEVATCCQALAHAYDPGAVIKEAIRISDRFIITVGDGETCASTFTPESLCHALIEHAEIERLILHDHIIIAIAIPKTPLPIRGVFAIESEVGWFYRILRRCKDLLRLASPARKTPGDSPQDQ